MPNHATYTSYAYIDWFNNLFDFVHQFLTSTTCYSVVSVSQTAVRPAFAGPKTGAAATSRRRRMCRGAPRCHEVARNVACVRRHFSSPFRKAVAVAISHSAAVQRARPCLVITSHAPRRHDDGFIRYGQHCGLVSFLFILKTVLSTTCSSWPRPTNVRRLRTWPTT